MIKLLNKLKGKETVSLIVAGVFGSMTNTVLVMGMIYIFFGESYAAAMDVAYDALIGVIMGVVGFNGVLEAITAAILACVISKVLMQITKRYRA